MPGGTLRPYSTIEYIGYGDMEKNGKLVPTYKVKDFFQKMRPFFVKKSRYFSP